MTQATENNRRFNRQSPIVRANFSAHMRHIVMPDKRQKDRERLDKAAMKERS